MLTAGVIPGSRVLAESKTGQEECKKSKMIAHHPTLMLDIVNKLIHVRHQGGDRLSRLPS